MSREIPFNPGQQVQQAKLIQPPAQREAQKTIMENSAAFEIYKIATGNLVSKNIHLERVELQVVAKSSIKAAMEFFSELEKYRRGEVDES